MKLQGIFPPLTTPFDHNGDIWKVKVEHNVARLNLTSLAGYVVIGSTGESKLLTTEEKTRLWEWVAEFAAPEKILIAGTGVESVRETVALTNRAAGMGYKAALVMTPHYYKNLIASPDAQKLYFRSVADRTNIPVIIYNWPQMTGIDIAPEAVADLSQHPNVIGIKESSGNLAKVVQMLSEVKAGFNVLVGSAPTIASNLQAGASGGILAFANAAPYACISIYEAHRTREHDAALDWQRRIARAATLVTVKYGIPGLKYAMDLEGYYGGPPRLPLTPPNPHAKKEIEAAFAGLRG
jgi:4-hydroxy-2-oxoglutarate aldolase